MSFPEDRMSLAAQFARISAAGRVRQGRGNTEPRETAVTRTSNRPFFSAEVLVIGALIIGVALLISRGLVAAIQRLLFE